MLSRDRDFIDIPGRKRGIQVFHVPIAKIYTVYSGAVALHRIGSMKRIVRILRAHHRIRG